MNTLTKVRFQSVADTGWQEVWEIYTQSFPPYEIRTEEAQKKLMTEKDYFCMALYEEKTLVGILFYWETETIRYVEHLAISPHLRGKNYGSRIMGGLCSTEKIVILEIDPPIDEISKKRQQFYENLGFFMNPFHFIHPSYTKIKHPHQLKIMSSPRKLEQKEFDDFIEYLHQKVLQYVE